MESIKTILSVVKQDSEEKTRMAFRKVIGKYCNEREDGVLKIGINKNVTNQLLFALNVPAENAISVIKELTYEGISVVKNETFVKIAVTEATNELQAQQANTMSRLKKEESVKQKLRKKKDYTIDDLLYLKDWRLMLDVAIKQSSDKIDESRKIKELLPDVIKEAIELEQQRDFNNLDVARNCIENLMLIAENESLKRFHMHSLIKKAGDSIIEICLIHPKELIRELIFLANSGTSISYINVLSFLTFFEVIYSDQELYREEIIEGTKYLNTWTLEVVHLPLVRLSIDDSKIFKLGIKYFKELRKSV